MLDVQHQGNVAVIDLRERILSGQHPKQEVVEYVKNAKKGTIIELHLPHPAKPLALALEGIGYPSVMHRLGPEHYRLMCVILEDHNRQH